MKGNKEERAALLGHLKELTTVITTVLERLKSDPSGNKPERLVTQVDKLSAYVFYERIRRKRVDVAV